MNQREQLLKTLNDDLKGFKVPELYDEAKKAEIRKGRKSQADIDKGRDEIARNRQAYDDALTARQKLIDKIEKLTGDNETAERQARQESPLNQGIQYGKSLGIPAAGYVAGHVAGAKFGKAYDVPASERASGVKRLAAQLRGVDDTSPTAKGTKDAIVRTYDKTVRGRSPAQFLGPAFLGASSVATQYGADYADDPTLKEGLKLAANAERFGAMGMGIQQLADTLRSNAATRRGIDPTDTAAIEAARRQVNAGGKFDRLQGALRDADPAPPAPPAAPAAKPAAKAGTVAAMRQQARDMQLKGYSKLDKEGLSKALAKAIREQGAKRGPAKPAAAAEGVVSKAIKGAKKGPKVLFPAAVGMGVYDSLRNPAEAGATDVAGFAAERLQAGGDSLVDAKEAYAEYVRQTAARGGQPVPLPAFLRQLREQGIGLARVAGADRLLASLAPAAAPAAPAASAGTAAAAGAGAAVATGGAMAGLGRLGSALASVPGVGTAARAIGRAVPPLAAGMTAYDVGNMAIEENAKPDQLLNGAQDGTMPQTPGNPGFMQQQQDLARQAHGMPQEQAPQEDLAPLMDAAAQDPEFAEELRQLIMARLEEASTAQQQQIPYAMASQEVAARGDPMADALRNMAMR